MWGYKQATLWMHDLNNANTEGLTTQVFYKLTNLQVVVLELDTLGDTVGLLIMYFML